MKLREIIDNLEEINSQHNQLKSAEVFEILSSIWNTVYCEGWSDPTNPACKQLALTLMDRMDSLNKLLKYKG